MACAKVTGEQRGVELTPREAGLSHLQGAGRLCATPPARSSDDQFAVLRRRTLAPMTMAARTRISPAPPKATNLR